MVVEWKPEGLMSILRLQYLIDKAVKQAFRDETAYLDG